MTTWSLTCRGASSPARRGLMQALTTSYAALACQNCVLRVELLGVGLFGDAVKVTTPERTYLVKKSQFRASPETLRYEADVRRHLHGSGLPLGELIAARDGQLGVVHEEKVYVLTEWVDGKQ